MLRILFSQADRTAMYLVCILLDPAVDARGPLSSVTRLLEELSEGSDGGHLLSSLSLSFSSLESMSPSVSCANQARIRKMGIDVGPPFMSVRRMAAVL